MPYVLRQATFILFLMKSAYSGVTPPITSRTLQAQRRRRRSGSWRPGASGDQRSDRGGGGVGQLLGYFKWHRRISELSECLGLVVQGPDCRGASWFCGRWSLGGEEVLAVVAAEQEDEAVQVVA